MVQIHNFLNEKAWEEVQKWEGQVNKCVSSPTRLDGRDSNIQGDRGEKLQLVRFKGRPGELSPKARFWLFVGWLLPNRFKYVSTLLVA